MDSADNKANEPTHAEGRGPTSPLPGHSSLDPRHSSLTPARPRRRRRRNLKKELSRKYAHSPFLQLLIHKPWFRLAVLLFVLLIATLGLSLPRVWKTSPAGVLPIVKVSGLELAQARTAKKRAARAEAASQFEEAVLQWQTALAQNPADVAALRGSLRARMASGPQAPTDLIALIEQMDWLLRLTGTNHADVALVAQVCGHYRLHAQQIRLLEGLRERSDTRREVARDAGRGTQSQNPATSTLDPRPSALVTLQVDYLATLFEAGRFDDFAQASETAPASLRQDPRFALYQSAYRAGWGQGSQKGASDEGRGVSGQRPTASTLDPRPSTPDAAKASEANLQLLADRLQLATALQRVDVAAYRAGLKRLSDRRTDTVSDHAGYWLVLARAGRQADAQELAEEFTRAPANPHEVIKLAEAFEALDRPDRARALLLRFGQSYRGAPEIWAAHGRLLMERQEWDELRALALKIRQQDGVHDTLKAYSYFLEGCAGVGEGRADLAEASFAKAAQFTFDDPHLGREVAGRITAAGFSAQARDIVRKLEAQRP